MESDVIERGITVAEFKKAENERVAEMFAGESESADEEAESILAKIREHGGESTVQKLKDCFAKYHRAGGAKALHQKLWEMVKDGILTVRNEPGKNGQTVEIFCIPSIPIPMLSKNTDENRQHGNGNDGNDSETVPE